ncbi:MAG: hypothetical protein INR71_08085 [Terriglobus roseus]|nr:hypothetical protein [Terriglobus roseus]
MQRQQPPLPPPPAMDEDDDVPESLLLDPGAKKKKGKERTRRKSRGAPLAELPPPVPGPATRTAKAQWRATKAQQKLHDEDEEDDGGAPLPRPAAARNPLLVADPKDRAMWKWANVENLDNYLAEVYTYFEQKGIWSILLRRCLSHLSGLFVVVFITFLTQCVDYAELPKRNKLSDIVVPQCTRKFGAGYNLLLWLFAVGWIYLLIQYLIDIPRLWDMHNFYHYLLGIPDRDIQTVSWQLVVSKLMALRDANAATVRNMSPETRRFISVHSKQRMDAHDIANRLMRKENYMIALINRDAFDVTVPLPFVGNVQFWTRTIQWNIGLCLMDWVFNDEGQVKEEFLTSHNRRKLIAKFRSRLFWFGVVNIVWAPFLVIFWVMSYFFQYFAVSLIEF